MNKEDFTKTIKVLGVAYDKAFTREQVEVWYSILGDYDLDTFKLAIKELIRSNKYLPSIAEVEHELKKLTIEDYSLDAKKEWGAVLEAIPRARRGEEEENLKKWLKPRTFRVCQIIGIRALTQEMEIDQRPSYQKLFLNLYEGRADYELKQPIYEENIKRLQEAKQDFLLDSQEI